MPRCKSSGNMYCAFRTRAGLRPLHTMIRTPILALVFTLTICAASFAQAASGASSVPYLSGGVGEDERAALQAVETDYSLKLSFASAAGNYLTRVSVRILDEDGRAVLDLLAEGPLLLVNLPAGRYRVLANADGRAQSHDVSIPAQGRRALVLRW